MEPKPSPSAAFGPSETLMDAPPRRRPGGGKRKNSSSSLFPSAKRLAKERNNPHAFLPPFHNGPVTRARQSPNKLAASAPAKPDVAAEVAKDGGGRRIDGRGDGIGEEEEVVVLESVVDAEFEAVRSRGSGVHVVPSHAGWFSWEKVHPLEERTMASFFNGKSEKRNREIYMDIRNAIIKKFRDDPNTQLSANDMSGISVGDLEARQEIMEFLDYWGLINFHPFPPLKPDTCAPDTEEAAKALSLVQKLYKFEPLRACSVVRPKRVAPVAPAAPLPKLLPESAATEDLTRSEEHSVEYHCNSCSSDCSRKRYHCQKKADFDLCSDCYNAEKFGPGTVATDFILMESAEARGVNGGSWTDQETLLLLEALELYGENWNEIAEHVATKTKSQCILHFVQMPIEDPFLEGNDSIDDILPKNSDSGSANKESASSDVPETTETKDNENGDKPTTVTVDDPKKNDDSETKAPEGCSTNIIIDALKAAFDCVGSFSEQGDVLSFAEAGNPVMALATFLANIVEPNAATTSIRSSLQATSEKSPGIQLATRHCFPLEDPPNDCKDKASHTNELPASMSENIQKEENHTPNANGFEDSKENTETKDEKPLQQNEEVLKDSSENKNVKENDEISPQVDIPNAVVESGNLEPLADQVACNVANESGDQAVQEKTGATLMTIDSQGEAKSSKLFSTTGGNNLPGEDEQKPKKDCNVVTSSNKINDSSETPAAEDIVCSSAPQNEKEPSQSTDLCSANQTNLSSDKEDKRQKLDAGENKTDSVVHEEHNISRIKRAAVTAVSAAAVRAKLLAEHEENQIRQLASMTIEKELQKLEMKLGLFTDIEGSLMRVKEQLDRTRRRLYQERSQIIAARFGGPPASSRPPSMASDRPPVRRT